MFRTLVAFHGPKPPALAAWIASVQEDVRRHFGEAFAAYRPEQVHATIAGLEGVRDDRGEVVNDNFLQLRGERRPMDADGIVAHVRGSALLPFTVRLGGYAPERDYGFQSRGAHPYERSFTLQGANVVVMGWPLREGAPLATLRRELERFGVLHKYHAVVDALDDDLFFVLGRVHGAVDGAVRHAAIADVRAAVARSPLDVTLGVEALRIVEYDEPTLAPDTTRVATYLGAAP